MKKLTLSIVIPAYNEEKIIKMSLGKIIDYLKVKRYDWEIVVADDGSVDKTKDLIKNLTHKNKRIKLVRLPQNKGKGGALKKGILAAKGKYIIFMDADLSVDLGNIDIFLKQLKKESPVVIASRRVKGAEIEVHQPWHREVMGRVFTFLTRILMQVNVADFTCGFKGFTNEAAKKIFSKSLINRWAYDAEIMFLSNKFGYKIRQMPIVWKNRGDTRVRLKNVIFESFMDLLKIRLNDLRGVYD
ncbi:hypothetical protein A2865_03335 [Candidatus Woesebacteria bacterium RIFCSPHIGHO2_01_FULL_39_17]|uniref:Glycosyltransferase 2-like domain-containing protein n=3 Tax=Candidatus Woeseibacteriota TaxID=1752722 RepID=A0A0G0NAF0_9BACT|nr:MAG: hypothetical protein US72_C0010G0043 [Microgenomates group bacterium GW2011_GWC1_38_12]KKQ94061.1 MAG: hypothetical protein UT19_C0004G0022 [Candidatus Woesebacteria bacterium GW2011_GWB1_39_10b]KKR12448.1 MAG: hypothetical protein UT40_C0026G0009 [Candidatus Woesebacteria bacterium GW2011_GWA1_39_21b]OGM24362.1 MAG: hypothetical protein A2865_03335 [Candidatus Woesebacteria bacterium RIFCSPHIGHO2_01_FULL_39_17]OGM61096.1 MAG: hypothetical protein A3A52_04875 [Candidatus Woesebacteria b